MKQSKTYMRFIMEEADDARLLDFGFPNKIHIYSSVKNWFIKVTQKGLFLCSFPTAAIMIMFIVKPKNWPIGEQVAFCLIPYMVTMPLLWVVSFIQGYILPKRVRRRFNDITDSAFVGFQTTWHNPGCVQLLKDNEEWYMEFYQEQNKNLIEIQTLYKSEIEGHVLSEVELPELFRSFCERRNATLKNKSLARYVKISPYSIRVILPLKLKLTETDYINIYKELKAFVKSINCEIVSLESY